MGRSIAWYYTPMMLPFSKHVTPDVTVYDAMDELSKFKFAPEHLLDLEQELIDRADVVFTGGSSLYEAKKDRHDNVHCFPSSVDRTHFCKARARQFDPADQEDLPKPRLGFYGVIDERFDIELLAKVAEMRPDWSFVMVGPVVKIATEDLPKRPNIHYLGGKTYGQLPAYLSGWDVALMPFAMNESTQFISPTKTPEYLAGGKPVVSTPIRDVVRHYGELEGVKIASTPEEFVAACEEALELSRNPESGWLRRGRPHAVGVELGHDPGADGRPHRGRAWEPGRSGFAGAAGRRGMSAADQGRRRRQVRLSDRRRRLRRLRARRAPRVAAWRARPAHRPPAAHRRQCL